MYLCAPCVCMVPMRPEGIRSLGTGVTHSYEVPCGGQKLNVGPLQEQPVSALKHSAISPAHRARIRKSFSMYDSFHIEIYTIQDTQGYKPDT